MFWSISHIKKLKYLSGLQNLRQKLVPFTHNRIPVNLRKFIEILPSHGFASKGLAVLVCIMLLATISGHASAQPTELWHKTWGGNKFDKGNGVAIGNNGIYVVGNTWYLDRSDALLIKYEYFERQDIGMFLLMLFLIASFTGGVLLFFMSKSSKKEK